MNAYDVWVETADGQEEVITIPGNSEDDAEEKALRRFGPGARVTATAPNLEH